MRITKIVQQKRKKERFSIFIDGRYSFSLSEENLIKHKLKTGQEINETQIEDINREDEKKKAINSVFHLLSIRSRSEKELGEKLKTKKISEENITDAIGRIKELGYINDEKFAKERISYLRQKGKGPFIIKMDLRRAGIQEDTINELLFKDKTSKNIEIEQVKNIVLSRLKRMGKIDAKTKFNRLMGFLARRGFDIETIKEGLKEAKLDIEKDDSV
ncbi:MAG: RecX family transcriptional regulator [Elusimicrobia bacterium]|nr:RecX family transcriptional regulator [Elusimicrobiota bacterium]